MFARAPHKRANLITLNSLRALKAFSASAADPSYSGGIVLAIVQSMRLTTTTTTSN